MEPRPRPLTDGSQFMNLRPDWAEPPLFRASLHLVNRIAVAGDVRGHVGGCFGFGVAEGAGLRGDAGVFLADGGEPGFGGLQGERVIPDRQDDIEVQGAAGCALGPDIVDMDGGLRGHA